MVQGNSEVLSKQMLSDVLRHAESNDLKSMRSGLEADADPVVIAQRYADVAQALYHQRKNVAQMLAVAKAGIAYCLGAAEQAAAKDPTAAATLKTKAKVIAYNAGANSWPHYAIAHRGWVRSGDAFIGAGRGPEARASSSGDQPMAGRGAASRCRPQR
jgi:hypothetical protein